MVQLCKQRDEMVAADHVTSQVQGEERGRVAAAEGGKGGGGHGLNRPQCASLRECEKEGRCAMIHLHICAGMRVNIWSLQNYEAIQGLQEMEGMRISALANLAKSFWGPPSHLVEYLYLDHVGVTSQVKKTFPSGKSVWHF